MTSLQDQRGRIGGWRGSLRGVSCGGESARTSSCYQAHFPGRWWSTRRRLSSRLPAAPATFKGKDHEGSLGNTHPKSRAQSGSERHAIVLIFIILLCLVHQYPKCSCHRGEGSKTAGGAAGSRQQGQQGQQGGNKGWDYSWEVIQLGHSDMKVPPLCLSPNSLGHINPSSCLRSTQHYCLPG